MRRPPEVRAGWSKTLLGGVDALPESARHAALAALGPESRKLIESSINLRWIAIKPHMELLRSVRAHLPEEAYVAYFARAMRSALGTGGVFGKAAAAALRWLTDDPFAVLRYVPTSAAYIFRGVGTIALEEAGPDALRVVHTGWPPALGGGDEFWLGWLGSLEAVMEAGIAGRPLEAHVRLESVDEAAARAVFRCEVARAPLKARRGARGCAP
ncbi:MAG: hypothetical protein AAGH15_08265 [Myxococcota bacterium]